MKRSIGVVLSAMMLVAIMALAGCASGSSASASASASAGSSSQSASASQPATEVPADGEYVAEFKTDSSMFHVNETDDGKGILTVKDGEMTIHVSLASKKIVNVYRGTADAAKTDAANVIDPSTDTMTYSDGTTDDVYGFDIPVPALDEEFDVAILGEKGTWYDHKVSVSNPVAL